MQQSQLEWRAFEHEHIHKSSDWFWALGIIAIAGAVTAIIFNNILFAIVILVGAFTLSVHAVKKPNLVNFKISERGIIIDNTLHPYSSLESFWVEDESEQTSPKLLIKSKKLLAPHIIIPIENASPNDIRDYLLEYLAEEEDSESLAQKIVEFFGF
ncbi:MAG: hypothetical protein CMI57_02920 [Parcubacteria group bacterium]|jgi:hypothetical protein|nr:hypothetical protein [Parcubacteria group bacterium]